MQNNHSQNKNSNSNNTNPPKIIENQKNKKINIKHIIPTFPNNTNKPKTINNTETNIKTNPITIKNENKNTKTHVPENNITHNINIYFHLVDNHLAIIYPFKSISMDINIDFIKQQIPIKLMHCIHLLLINLPNKTQNTITNIQTKINNLTIFYNKATKNNINNPSMAKTLKKIQELLKNKNNTLKIKNTNRAQTNY